MQIKILESSENYLETILMIQEKKGNVRSVDIAHELSFSKASVSVAMKNLRLNGYIRIDDDGHIFLEPKGLEIAEKMYERHLLLTNWLMTLGVSEQHASEDACRMEHIMSDETFDAIKKAYKK